MQFLEQIIFPIRGYIVIKCVDCHTYLMTKQYKQSNLWLDNGYKKIIANEIGVYTIISTSTRDPQYTDTDIPNVILSNEPSYVWQPNEKRKLFISSFEAPLTEIRTINTVGLASTPSGTDAWCYTKLHEPIIQKETEILYIYYYILFDFSTELIENFGIECINNLCEYSMVSPRVGDDKCAILHNTYFPNSRTHSFIDNVPIQIQKHMLSLPEITTVKDKYKLNVNIPLISINEVTGIWSSLTWNMNMVFPSIPFPHSKSISRIWGKRKESLNLFFDSDLLPLGSLHAVAVKMDSQNCELTDVHQINVEIMKSGSVEEGEYRFTDTVSSNLSPLIVDSESRSLGSIVTNDDVYIFILASSKSFHIWSKTRGTLVNTITLNEDVFYFNSNDKTVKCLPVLFNNIDTVIIISNSTKKLIKYKWNINEEYLFVQNNWSIHSLIEECKYAAFQNESTLLTITNDDKIKLLDIDLFLELEKTNFSNFLQLNKDREFLLKNGTYDKKMLTYINHKTYIYLKENLNTFQNLTTVPFTSSQSIYFSLINLYSSELNAVNNVLTINSPPNLVLDPMPFKREKLHHIFTSSSFEITVRVELPIAKEDAYIGLNIENGRFDYALIRLIYKDNKYVVQSITNIDNTIIYSNDIPINQSHVYLRLVKDDSNIITLFYSKNEPIGPSSWSTLIPNNTTIIFPNYLISSAGLTWYNQSTDVVTYNVRNYEIHSGTIDNTIQSTYNKDIVLGNIAYHYNDQISSSVAFVKNDMIIATDKKIIILDPVQNIIKDQVNITDTLIQNIYILNENDKAYIVYKLEAQDKIYYWSSVSNKILYLKSEIVNDYRHYYSVWKTGEKLIYNWNNTENKWFVGDEPFYRTTLKEWHSLYPGILIRFQPDSYAPAFTLSNTDKYTFIYTEHGFIKDNMQAITNLGFNLYIKPIHYATQIISNIQSETTLAAYLNNQDSWLTADFTKGLYSAIFYENDNETPRYLNTDISSCNITQFSVSEKVIYSSTAMLHNIYGYYNNKYIRMKSGECINQIRKIKEYDNYYKRFTLDTFFDGNLQVNDYFEICDAVECDVLISNDVPTQPNQICINEKEGKIKVFSADENMTLNISYIYLLR